MTSYQTHIFGICSICQQLFSHCVWFCVTHSKPGKMFFETLTTFYENWYSEITLNAVIVGSHRSRSLFVKHCQRRSFMVCALFEEFFYHKPIICLFSNCWQFWEYFSPGNNWLEYMFCIFEIWPVLREENFKTARMSSAIFVDAKLNLGCETKSLILWRKLTLLNLAWNWCSRQGLGTPYSVKNMWWKSEEIS